jgi:hypothetical protein
MKTRSATAAKSKASCACTGAGTSIEVTLARVESIRLEQRSEGHFDCFGKAKDGYCDQEGCRYHSDCTHISQLRF